MVRLGAVPFLNARPLVFGLEQGGGRGRIALSYDVPARLAERLAAGDLDGATLPSIELARIGGLVVAPGLSIASRGPAASVLLLSKRPLDRIRSVALDPESRTSNALVRILFDGPWDGRPAFEAATADLTRALHAHDAAVRIGDKALFEPVPPGVEVWDLGAAWTIWTGLPFVFAVWAFRDGSLDREIYEALHASRRSGAAALAAIAVDYTWNGRRDPELAATYLSRHIFYRLGDPEVAGLRRFLAEAARLGLAQETAFRLATFRDTPCAAAGS
jgi:chorismate dehydratase